MHFVRVNKSETQICNGPLDGPSDIVLTFSTSVYERTKLEKNDNVYVESNRYLQTLSQQQQDTIFDVYQRIHDEIKRSPQFEVLSENLKKLVSELYKYLDIGNIERWVFGFNKIRYPTSVSTSVTADLNPAKTYIRADYDALVVLTIALRFMLPVWGAYQMCVLPTVKGKFKEYVAAQLLTESTLINHRSVKRLQLFIENQISPNAKKEAAILSGLGTEELPDWLLGGALVKRLAVADIHDEGGLIRNVYGFVHNYLTEMDQYWGGLRPKNAEGGDDENSDFSIMERYRGKKLRSEGDIRAASVYVTRDSGRGAVFVPEDHIRLTHHIDPTVPMELIAACYQNNAKSPLQNIVQEWQVILAQFVMYRTSMSPKSVASLNKAELTNVVFVVAQAVLIHWGFIHIGLLMKAEPLQLLSQNQMLQMPTMSRITAKTMEPLEKTYPYELNGTKASTNKRQANVAYVAINELATMMNKHHWVIPYEAPLIALLGPLHIMNPGPVTSDVQETLALLSIRLNTKGDI